MSVDQIEKEITKEVEAILAGDPSLFVVEISLKGTSGNQRLSIFLDGDAGISIEQCVGVSRKLSAFLEENDLIPGKFYLEVSSAGVDQPLKFERQYRRNIGRSVKVKTKDGEKVEGVLAAVAPEGFSLTVKEKKVEQLVNINFDQVDSTKVLVSFK